MRFEFSAGGIVVKRSPSTSSGPEQVVILLAQHGGHHGWVFPKGLIERNPSTSRRSSEEGSGQAPETKEHAALREVEEETGVLAKLGKALTPITYWYQMDGEKRKKTVYYFLMEFVSEDSSKKDDEMENVEWVPMEEVEKKLTYPSDRAVWKEAKQFISSQ